MYVQEYVLSFQVPEIRDDIVKENSTRWEAIARKQHANYYTSGKVDLMKHAQRWNEIHSRINFTQIIIFFSYLYIYYLFIRLAATYDFDMLDACLSDTPKCVLCGSDATKRCSRCQNEWYCRRYLHAL